MNLERKRGFNDALAGHGPAMFAGDYMIGYRRGRAKIGQPMHHQEGVGSSMIHVVKETEQNEVSPELFKHTTYCGIKTYVNTLIETEVDESNRPIITRAKAWGWRATCAECLVKSHPEWIKALEELYKAVSNTEPFEMWKKKHHRK